MDEDISKFLKSIDKSKTTKVLGKGISALLGDVPLHNNINILKVKLDDCISSPFQARKEFNQEDLESLAQSIKEKGIIQPVILRKTAINKYEIVAGERRCRAARMAGMIEIPAIVDAFSDQDVMEIGLIENIQRKDLTVLEEARGYKYFADNFNLTHDEVGKLLGKSRSYISNYLRILKLPEGVLELIDKNLISAGHAKMLVNEKDPTRLAQLIVDKNMSVKDMESIIREKQTKKNKSVNKRIAFYQEQKDLEKALKQLSSVYTDDSVTVKHKYFSEDSGEITISYDSIKDVKKFFGLN